MARTKSLTPMMVLAVAGTTSGCSEAVRDGALDPLQATGERYDSTPGDAELVQVTAKNVTYGRSVEGRTLSLIKIAGPPRRSGIRPAALVMGGAQGGEELGVLHALAMAMTQGWVLDDDARDGRRALDGAAEFLRSGGVLYVVPRVNPDGIANGTYGNARGVNLNRDWHTRSQPETSALVEYLRAEAEFSGVDVRLSVDYHVGIPRLLYPRADSPRAIPVADLAGHLTFHELLPQRIRKPPISLYDSIRDLYASAPSCDVRNDCVLPPRCFDGGANCDCLHHDEWDGGRCVVEDEEALRIEREGLSNDFFYDAFGAMAFVYEADPAVDFRNVVDHAVWWDRNLAYLATGEVPAIPLSERVEVRPQAASSASHVVATTANTTRQTTRR